MKNRNFTIGIDLGGTKIYAAVANSENHILAKVKIPTGEGKNNVLENIFLSIKKFLKINRN